MPDSDRKAELTVEVRGAKRGLLVLRANAKGDVFITIRAGFNLGSKLPPNHTLTIEDRISLHPNSRGGSPTMIKYQCLDENDIVYDDVAFTESVAVVIDRRDINMRASNFARTYFRHTPIPRQFLAPYTR